MYCNTLIQIDVFAQGKTMTLLKTKRKANVRLNERRDFFRVESLLFFNQFNMDYLMYLMTKHLSAEMHGTFQNLNKPHINLKEKTLCNESKLAIC